MADQNEVTKETKKAKEGSETKPEKKEFSEDEFRIKFRAFFATLSFVVGMFFVAAACFSQTAAESKFTGTVIGFICGTLITMVVTYYYGSSDKKAAPPVPPPDPSQGQNSEQK